MRVISNQAVPVIMYHSVGVPNKNWLWSHLTCPYGTFESHLIWLKRRRFHTISLQTLYDYMKERVKLPQNPLVLTFDDGYLDNWVFAYPLLRKYGFSATIFVNPEFADSQNVIRTNLEDFWEGEAEFDELPTLGYLSWREMKRLEDEKVMTIQSHTMSHTWYIVNGRIIDFRHPGDPYIWMTWNENPTQKANLQVDNEELVHYGEPVCEHARSIGTRRYFLDDDFRQSMIEEVERNGGEEFFRVKNWRDELFSAARNYRDGNRLLGRCETEEEYEERIYYELWNSKRIIETKLDKEVKFLCWPGGIVTGKALKMASDMGYVSSTVGRDLEHEKKYLRNRYGENPSRINRMGSTLYWNGIEGFGSRIRYKSGFHLVLSLHNFQGRKMLAPVGRLILIAAIGVYRVLFH